jgi:hypothetical protein
MTILPCELPEFVWIWNNRLGLDTPAHHRRIARWLAARGVAGERRLLLMAFRGAGKSTLVGLWCAWLLLRRPETRILILAADQPLAVKMAAQVRRIVERHPLCRHLRPNTPESWASDRFAVSRAGAPRDPSVLAAGIGGNITGARADVIVCDDVEVAGNCDTEAKREELRERLAEAEFVLVPGGTVLFVGTPHTAESLYRAPAEGGTFLQGYRRLVIPVVSPTGRPAWPERFGLAEIAALRDRVGPLAFRRQMLLQAVSEQAARLDPALLVRYAAEPDYAEAGGRPVLRLMGRRLVSGGGFWDPAYGRPSGGDASVLAVTYADDQGHQYAHRLFYITHDPDDAATDPATQQCRAVARAARELLLPVLRVETNGIGRFLPGLLRQEFARAGVACSLVEHTSHRNKAERILSALDPLLAARRLFAHESLFRTPFPREMAEWRPGSVSARDDALDALAGALLAEPVRFPALPPAPPRPAWRGG